MVSQGPTPRTFVVYSSSSSKAMMNDLVLSEEVLWSGGFFRVKRQRVRGRDGKHFFRELASRKDGVAVVPIQADGRVIMIREYAGGAHKPLLFVPGGETDATTESQRQAEAQRELREEIGLRANKLIKLWQTFEAPAVLERRIFIYLGLELVADRLTNPDDSFIEPMPMAIDEAIAAVSRPNASSAAMLGALTLARDYLDTH